MMKFLSKNHKDYVLYLKKWEKIGTSIEKYPRSNQTYTKNIFDWVTYETKLSGDENGYLPYIFIDNKKEQIRGYNLSCKDISNSNYYYGGITTEVKASIMTWYGTSSGHVELLERFVERIPKKSRKKLIRLIFLYELNEEKTYNVLERLYHRLTTRFGLELCIWGHTTHKFTGFKPTYSLDRNRNKKINCLFRYGRSVFRK